MFARLLAGFPLITRCAGSTLLTLFASTVAIGAEAPVPSRSSASALVDHRRQPVVPFTPRDPLVAMVRRVDRFLARNSVGGVAFDSRYDLNRTEVARLTATCQLLGYAELNRVIPRNRFRKTVGLCADSLLARFAEVRSGTVFDGMLGYAMLKAYETTDDPRYLAAAEDVIAELTAIPRSEYILNGGMMAALAFAEHYHLTGNTDSEALARLVLAGEPAYQHADGCFPHWCSCTRDISYTDWMSMELILIQRAMDDPHIDPMLAGTLSFMEGRIDEQGQTHYEAECPDYSGCVIEYWSRGSGCSIDTETRGFTNEPAYSALLFDHFHSPRYPAVLGFLQSIESNGTWPDQWDYFVPPSDAYYPWANADTSVINISINFWTLTSILSGREDRRGWELEWPGDDAEEGPRSILAVPHRLHAASAPAVSRMQIASSEIANACDSPAAIGATSSHEASAIEFAAITPNPSRAEFEIRFALPVRSRVALSIYDVAGRRVRPLISQELQPGDHSIHWDGRDAAGQRCSDGVYFAELRRGNVAQVVRLSILR